jgi:anaerobic dimethyl sulfoxide reductase subunit C (anchor subunit)
MTKCNFCFDNIDSGNPPACVAACPLRVLNYVEIPKSGDFGVQDGYIPLWTKPASEHPFPMSPISRTEPHLAVKPHKAMVFNDDAQRLPSLEIAKSGDFAVQIGNVEEIRPRKESAWDEIPLVIFTLLAQLSVGAFWFALLFLPKPLTLLPLSIIGLSLGLGMSFSFAHLGTKKNAWRVLTHLRKSWLSREILSASLFGAGWLAVTVENLFFPRPTPYLSLLTALLGLFFIHSMVNVYRIPAKPAWNTWRTNAAFFISALLLGMLAMLPILLVDGNQTQSKFIGVAIVALIVGQWSITGKRQTLWQNILNFTAIFSTAIILFGGIGTWQSSISVFAIVLVGELLTRMRFYAMEQKT